jgi:RNA polymerase-binding transcription factor
MNKTEVNRFKAVLMKTREAIAGKSRERESIWIAPSNELMETVQLAAEREFAIRALESQTKCLSQVEAALERIEDGEFGICLECEEPISAKRLAAVPWAVYCLHCQELEDRRQGVKARMPSLAA